ncbi:MAG: SprT family zinc-dependent metalloprotease [Colwellia polaris]|uniref:M48 family metallopeptidase n=1 Tax=Colwellia polaris TaxID=326537 RepID=UPI000A16D5BD|nr:SprT family zinc-dependent metalloprotease [Colwellia polaris]
MEYQLIRSERRKTIGLQVKNAQVIVRAPTFVKTSYVESLIQAKLQWLNQKIAEQQQNSLVNPSFSEQFTRENTKQQPSVFIDGLPHRIIVSFGSPNVIHDPLEQSLTVIINKRYHALGLHCDITVSKIKSQIERWFKVSIENYLVNHLAIFSNKMSLHASSVKVRKYKSRWGSCNSRAELSFNYLLKMLPTWVVDYVIVHELCHIEHMNHSTKFWQLVAIYCPEYKNAKIWMHKNQPNLKWS